MKKRKSGVQFVPKTKTILVSFTAIIVALTGIYIVSTALNAPLTGGVLSPLAAAISGLALLYSYLKTNRYHRENRALLLIAAGCFFWMISDILWGVCLYQGNDPAHSVFVSLGYIAANIVIGAGAIYMEFCRYSRWKRIKNLVEALTIGILSVLFIWIVFFNKDERAAALLTSEGILSVGAIFLDLFIIVELIILFFTGLRKQIPFAVRLIRTGLFLFFGTGLVYFYCLFKNVYYTGSAIDVLFIFSLVLLAFGALWKTIHNHRLIGQTGEEELGRSRWIYFLLFPLLSIIAGGFDFVDLIMYGGLIALYHASIKFVELAKKNERLMQNVQSANTYLEKRVSDQLRELSILANQDTVTNLYNRRYFTTILDAAIHSLQEDEAIAVLQFDVDRFKTINDSYGHDVGDKVIIELSNRLTNWNKCGAVLARLGGDEFVVLMRAGISRNKLAEYCKQIIELCSAPIQVERQVLYVTISIGVSSCPKDARDSVSLMKNSDIAMYKAKAEGYNKFVFFNPSFRDNISRKNEIEALLRNADLQTEFELVYQPQFTLPDKKLIGAEALIRWKSAEHGYIPPSVFVPVAEEINYINRIGKWVLTKAVEQIIKWNTEYGLELKMGINISPKQLSEDDFFMTLKKLITTNQINTSWIDAEITENLMIEEKARVKPIFDLFKELEISVSIDDFGSGYSSLGYLNKYHFDRIKIDKSLVDNLTMPGGSGVEVVKAIITMSNAVGKAMIAEGVETKEQLQILTELGCRQVQGYLLGKPMPADEFEKKFIRKDLAVVV